MTLMDPTPLEAERRALLDALAEHTTRLIDAAHAEGFNVGFRAGQQAQAQAQRAEDTP